MKKFLKNCIEDILILSGLSIFVLTTFFLSKIAGLYSLSIILFGLGVYFARYPINKRR